MIFHFFPPSNPLDDSPTFRQGRIRRTPSGLIVCHFCGADYDEDGAYTPCCIAADEWNTVCRDTRRAQAVRNCLRSLT